MGLRLLEFLWGAIPHTFALSTMLHVSPIDEIHFTYKFDSEDTNLALLFFTTGGLY